jgi:hypothetical protein
MYRIEKTIDLGDYDEQGGSMLSLNDWITLYQQKTSRKLNSGTIRKRRAMSNLGTLVPPRVYLLSKDDFEKVLATPLPMCKNVVKTA